MKFKKTRIQIESDIDMFKRTIQEVNSYEELGNKYSLARNGKSSILLKEYIGRYNLSTHHWDRHKSTRIHQKIDKICPQCKTKFKCLSGGKNNKICCGHKCSNIYFAENRRTEGINQKISTSLKNFYLSEQGKIALEKLHKKLIIARCCLHCKNSFTPRNNITIYCSPKCRNTSPIYREKLRQIQLKKVKEGTHSGWKSRNQPSYAELFFMKVLTNNNISYKFEETCGKYFIDFAIHDKKIALEIDGKQHLQEDRKISDQLKDEYLKLCGWNVYRIPWKSINTKIGKFFIESEINKFLEYYNNF